jgi:rhodanese-related sulfurtransferase
VEALGKPGTAQPGVRPRVWRQDLGWAAFILGAAALIGLLHHWQLVQVAWRGELRPYLEKLQARQREVALQGVKTVNLEQAYALYREGKALFVDARPPEEYAELHIPGAVNLPPDTLRNGLPQAVAGVAKDRPLVAYCGQVSCDAALKVAEGLQSLGFTQVTAFLGGFRAWDEAGYPADTSK